MRILLIESQASSLWEDKNFVDLLVGGKNYNIPLVLGFVFLRVLCAIPVVFFVNPLIAQLDGSQRTRRE